MLNTVIIMGRFSCDPELKHTPEGTSVTSFSLAVSRPKRVRDGEKEVDWIDCVAWQSTAEFIVKYFKKGDLTVVEGRLKTCNYEDKHGNKKKIVEVTVKNINFAGSSSKNAKPVSEEPNSTIQFTDDGDMVF